MIDFQITNSNPATFNGGVFTQDITVIAREDTINPSFDYDAVKCCYFENVFAEEGGDDWKNDKRHLLISLSIPSDTVTFKLFKNDIELATISDNTYGVYNPVGTWTTQPLKASFYADFEKIFVLEGAGCYRIEADRVIINEPATRQSVNYILKPYTPIGAHKTIKITSVQDGTIERNLDANLDLSYKGMVFENQIRIPTFEVNIEKLEEVVENYRSILDNVEQIQDGLFESYRIKTGGIPSSISEKLFKDMLLANEIKLTSYDLFSNRILIDVDVFKKEITEQIYPQGQTLGYHEFVLQNRGFLRKRNI